MDLAKYLEEKAHLVNKTLLELLPPPTETPTVIHEAMHYSVFAGGKRLRPILCLASAEAVGQDSAKLLPVASALELIHTYSLIHDDLPAMDNDDYRRGKLTSHKYFGEGIAILAGDALLTLAFECLSAYGVEQINSGVSPLRLLTIMQEIAEAAGTKGMIGGQTADLDAEGKIITGEELSYIHQHKTGALFRAAIRAGVILSGGSERELAALTTYGEQFGLAFQITDDILDVTGKDVLMGKSSGRDLKKQKGTYPSVYGQEKSIMMAREAVERAKDSLCTLPGETEFLFSLANYLLGRES